MAYRLRKLDDGRILSEWTNMPKRVVFPNGDAVHSIAAGHEHAGYVFETFERPPTPVAPPNASNVESERDRRLALGFDYDFGDARGVHRIGTTPDDLNGWNEVSTLAGALARTGDMTATITILTDTGLCAVTALEWANIEIAAGAFRQPIWTGSFVLSAMDPVPTDYATNDSYWT